MIFNYNYHTHRLHSVSHINQGLCFYQKTGFSCNSKQVGQAIQTFKKLGHFNGPLIYNTTPTYFHLSISQSRCIAFRCKLSWKQLRAQHCLAHWQSATATGSQSLQHIDTTMLLDVVFCGVVYLLSFTPVLHTTPVVIGLTQQLIGDCNED